MFKMKIYLVFLISFCLGATAPSFAKPQATQDRVLALVESGVIVSYGAIKDKIEKQYQGHIVDVNFFETGESESFYKIKLLAEEGHVYNILIDAKTGQEIAVGY